MTNEQSRLEETRTGAVSWKKWGPYLSERQWGTVREDYSEGGDAWNYFTHDHVRSRGSSRMLFTGPLQRVKYNEKPFERRKEMKRWYRVTLIVAVLAAIAVVAAPALAQDKPTDNMQILVEKIRADKKLLVAENMQLTEAEAKAFWPVYGQYQEELFLLRVRTAKLLKDYADAYEKMNNDTAKRLLDEYMTIESLGLKLRQTYLPKFRKVLPEVKVVRYYQIENKIQAALIYEAAANIPLMTTAK